MGFVDFGGWAWFSAGVAPGRNQKNRLERRGDNPLADPPASVYISVNRCAAAGANNKIVYADPQTNPPIQLASDKYMIYSVTTINAMVASLRVNKIEGPVVNGGMRGVRFVEVGIVQNATFTQMHGLYKDFDLQSPPKRRVSTLEGQSYVDCWVLDAASKLPWYDSEAQSMRPAEVGRGVYPMANEPVSDALIANIDMKVADWPHLWGTDTMSPIALVPGGITDEVDRYEILFKCKDYLAVRTKEAANGSEDVFTQRARTPDGWYFNGSGDVVAGTWKGDVGVAKVDAVDGKDYSFTVVSDGTVVPITVAPIVNVKLAADTVWTWG